jgi:exonuclease III
MNQMGLIDIYRTLHTNMKEHTFFSALHRTFSKADHVLSHKASFNRCKKIGITTCILSDHHELRLDFNNNTNNRKLTNSQQLNTSIQ